MKSLIKFLKESIEIDKDVSKYYDVVTLVRREVDCSTISKEDFVKFIKEDLEKAIEEYKETVKAVREEDEKKWREDLVNNTIRSATSFANKKWKTEKRRNEYIENCKKNAMSKKYRPLSIPSFDFDPNPGINGIPQECIIHAERSTDESLGRCYEHLINSKHFKKAKGWAFKYETLSKDSTNRHYMFYSMRPYIDMILSESDAEERKRDKENLFAAMDAFYSKSNYWGD